MTPLRRLAVALPLALGLSLLGPGCMVIVGGRSDAAESHYAHDGEHGPQCPAIDTASSLTFSSDRTEALQRIARRKDLTEHEQCFVIDAAVESGGFSDDVADVLVTLAKNPTLAPGARSHLGRRQHDVSMFSSDRKRLAMALADAPEAGTAPGTAPGTDTGADSGAHADTDADTDAHAQDG